MHELHSTHLLTPLITLFIVAVSAFGSTAFLSLASLRLRRRVLIPYPRNLVGFRRAAAQESYDHLHRK